MNYILVLKQLKGEGIDSNVWHTITHFHALKKAKRIPVFPPFPRLLPLNDTLMA